MGPVLAGDPVSMANETGATELCARASLKRFLAGSWVCLCSGSLLKNRLRQAVGAATCWPNGGAGYAEAWGRYKEAPSVREIGGLFG